MAKRGRDYALATSLWEELSTTPRGNPEAIEALMELAIHYEHRGRDSAKAAQATREALAHLSTGWRRKGIAAGKYRNLRSRLEHRLERLTRKASRSLPLGIGRAEAGGEAAASNQQA